MARPKGRQEQSKVTRKRSSQVQDIETQDHFLFFPGQMYKKTQSSFLKKKPCKLYIDKDSRQLIEKRGSKQTTFDLYRIKEVKIRDDNELLMLYIDEDHNNKCRIYQADNLYILDKVVGYFSQVKLWQSNTQWFYYEVQSIYEDQNIYDLQYTWINRAWRKCNKQQGDLLYIGELVKLMEEHFNLKIDRDFISDSIQQYSLPLDIDSGINFEQLRLFLMKAFRRKDLEQIFMSISQNSSKVSISQFNLFLKETQQQQFSQSTLESIYMAFFNAQGYMDQEQFSLYILSRLNGIYKYDKALVYQDMDQPLSHYFIDSSHNTYLTGNQLIGLGWESSSSVEGYIRALVKGCRGVELDLQDGSDGEPLIFHKNSFTSSITVYEAIVSIKTYAFRTSTYPVILSLENNCSYDQQSRVGKILQDVLGSQIALSQTNYTQLPSPRQLQHKFIIKAKYYVKQKQIHEDLRKVVGCLVGYKPLDFSQENQDYTRCVSLKEQKSISFIKSNYQEYLDLNRSRVTRIYPGPLKLLSGNYDPVAHWGVGCQLVSLNFQTQDSYMLINKGMFRKNGQSGYVLKPRYMQQVDNTEIDYTAREQNKNFNAQDKHFLLADKQENPLGKQTDGSKNYEKELVTSTKEVGQVESKMELFKNNIRTNSIDNKYNVICNNDINEQTQQNESCINRHNQKPIRAHDYNDRISNNNINKDAQNSAQIGKDPIITQRLISDDPEVLQNNDKQIIHDPRLMHSHGATKMMGQTPSRPESTLQNTEQSRFCFSCKIISGQHLPGKNLNSPLKQAINPYVKVLIKPFIKPSALTWHLESRGSKSTSLDGCTYDDSQYSSSSSNRSLGTSSQLDITKTGHSYISDPQVSNGLNPEFNYYFQINLECVKDLSYVHFEVWDKVSDVKLAQNLIFFDFILQGYRHVPLYSRKNEKLLGSTLFVYCNITTDSESQLKNKNGQ